MSDYVDHLYKLLDMPSAHDSAIEIGHFLPADTPSILEEFAGVRMRQLTKAVDVASFQENKHALRQRLFHTYPDFLKQLKVTDTTRSDLTTRHQGQVTRQDLKHGHSLNRRKADHSGYLEYLEDAAPDLHEFLTTKRPARISQHLLRRHTHVLGQSGSGKTELIKTIIAAQVASPLQPTVIVIDPKGDFAEEVARWPEVQDRLVYIDPELDPTHTLQPCLNPFHLDDRTPEAIDAAAFQIKDQMAELLAADAALSTNMEALLMPCLALLLSRPNSTLEDLMQLVGDNALANSSMIAAGQALHHPVHSNFFAKDFQHKDIAPTKTAIRNRLRALLSSKRFYDLVIGKPTIDLKQLIDSRKIIIFNLRQGTLKESAYQLGRMVVAQLLIHVFARDNIPEADRVTVHCFIDEAQTIFTKSMPIILDQARSYGLHLTIAHQRFKQIAEAGLSSDMVDSFTTKIAARSDGRNRDELAGNIGIKPDEISSLSAGQYFARVENRPPFKLYGPTDRLGDRHSVSEEQWRATVAKQLAAYYRDTTTPLADTKRNAPNDTQTDHEKFMAKMTPEPTPEAIPDDDTNVVKIDAFKPKVGFDKPDGDKP